MKPRKCEACKQEFTPEKYKGAQRYCTDCSDAAAMRRLRDRWSKKLREGIHVK